MARFEAANSNNEQSFESNDVEDRNELISQVLELHSKVEYLNNLPEHTREQNEERKILNKEYSDALDGLTWSECVMNNLPWSPYLEFLKAEAANSNRELIKKTG